MARVEEVSSYHNYDDIARIRKNLDGYFIDIKQGQHYSIGKQFLSEDAEKFLEGLKEKTRSRK